ncbi:conserved hypothetical protein [Talaromyces stipitatus ATCC 10500]|uniref:Zn(2)-C6 fungal-type domain-containing protein n=1 Tax=Talaromyces stipitatus (strain ATCC 10500 / CBS 375.48 / QM 6759 / NRRL 1006) TaxID=441959 RepID=B8M874_TALSN|nr:uncharacterized protein TSTA_032890 [Talaromyces stipitatus ATCC 10500]EED20036.1 conserved hypothetical protein [Talaromyces stipitatus ATCC 10500]
MEVEAAQLKMEHIDSFNANSVGLALLIPMDSSGYNEAPGTGTGIQRRNRKPVSCTPCRQRKLRCDQALPVCDSCVRRGIVMSCSYQYRRVGLQRHWSSSHGNSSSVQSRMDRLEQLILALMNQKGPSVGDPANNLVITHRDVQAPRYEVPKEELLSNRRVGPTTTRIFRTDTDNGVPYTVGEAPWAALLNEIHEVRGYLQTQQKQYESQSQKISQRLKQTPEDSGPSLLFGTSQSSGHGEILSHVPSRYICDLLLERYFKTLDPALHILHSPTFQKQYEEHWENRSRAPVIWIGLLFAMMRIAAISWQRDGDEPLEFRGKAQDLSSSYRTRVTDCILLADYTKPQDFLIETLALHLYGEYASHRDADSSTWALLGFIIRLAMRMGYIQDPDRLASLSPFQAEMRRRVWTFVRQADIFFSFQHGFPSMIKVEATNGGLPRNIYDEDFGPSRIELPAPLPDSEATPISYLICKARLALDLARALKELNREDIPPPYERVLEIDRSIRETYAKVPEYFRLRSMAEQEHDQPSLIAARFTLANVHHKALCVVHSRLLEAARVDTRFISSRRACLESAMALLNLQAIQHQEIRAGGQVRSLTKYMTSLNAHDYLLAATILCRELFIDHRRPPLPFAVSGPTRNEMIESLDRSAAIWSQMRDKSIEAYKASDVLGMLLQKLRHPNNNLQEVTPQFRGYSDLSTEYIPEIRNTRNSAQMRLKTAIDDGAMAFASPREYAPRDQLSSTEATTVSRATPIVATMPLVPVQSRFSFSNVDYPSFQDPVRSCHPYQRKSVYLICFAAACNVGTVRCTVRFWRSFINFMGVRYKSVGHLLVK